MVARLAHPLAIEFNELPHHLMLTQHLGDAQDQIGGCGSFGELARQLEPDHPWNKHGNGLPQHGCLGLNTADTPADHAQAVDHGGMGVSAHTRVGIGLENAVDNSREDDPG